jgi:hypothetical protein
MIKIINNRDAEKLQNEANEYIKNCGCKIHSIKFTTTPLSNVHYDAIMYTCFIIADQNIDMY